MNSKKCLRSRLSMNNLRQVSGIKNSIHVIESQHRQHTMLKILRHRQPIIRQDRFAKMSKSSKVMIFNRLTIDFFYLKTSVLTGQICSPDFFYIKCHLFTWNSPFSFFRLLNFILNPGNLFNFR